MLIRTFLIIFLCCFSVSAVAQGTEDAQLSAAFISAKKKQWADAYAHAKAAHSNILAKYFTWEYLKDPQSDAPFANIVQFLDNNPGWPDRGILERRAEVALLTSNPDQKQLDNWFKKHPPRTSLAKLKAVKDQESFSTLMREAWVTEDYNAATEARLLEKYRFLFRPQEHIRRVDRLLWDGKEEEAKRLLKYVPYDYQRLFQARLSLMEGKLRIPIDMVNMPPALKNDSGLLYDHIRWRLRLGDKEGVRTLLLSAPADVPYPEKWWPIRDRQIREALGEGNLPLALALLAHHGQKEGSVSYREAQWLEGWIALEFEHKPERAYPIFNTLYKETETPSGKARVAYWAARAAEKTHPSAVKQWFTTSAHYPTTFYGELASWELGKDPLINLQTDTEPSLKEKEHFKKQELVQLVYALSHAHASDLAERFIIYLVESANSLDEVILATRLGREINRIDFGVRASKRALQNGILSIETAYPLIQVPQTENTDKAMLLALMRQESEFFSDAISASGACGLMQLLPHTAREIAHKSHLPYSFNLLFRSDYNMQVGSLYVAKMLEKFNGSYVLAVAAYNAGPGRVEQWIGKFGLPGEDARSVVNWIEIIPFTETRHYVQHVLENTEVYRFMLRGKTPVKLEIAQDLTR